MSGTLVASPQVSLPSCVAVEPESERLVPRAGHWSPALAHHTCKGVNVYVDANVEVVMDRRRDPRGAVE